VPSPPDTPGRLTARDIHKRFGPRTVLDGVDLHVDAGSVVLLAGTNGSGKTTLLRCIAGLADHDGRVTIDGEPWRGRRSDRRRIGYLPQSLGLPEWATVDEVLGLFARLRGWFGSPVDLPELPEGFLPPGDDRIDVLSGGQRQRVAIAVALLGSPAILLLDEPAANLDDEGRADLFAVLAGERDRGASIVVAAPSPGDLNGLPDRTVRLRDGRIHAAEPPVDRAPADETTVAIGGGTRIPEEVAS
jgi:ABC-type multidrug transport system ATPase subunit